MTRQRDIDKVIEAKRLMFDAICNPDDWKAPIDCVVHSHELSFAMNAIEFMTGIKTKDMRAEIHETSSTGDIWVRLQCAGYRAGPAGP